MSLQLLHLHPFAPATVEPVLYHNLFQGYLDAYCVGFPACRSFAGLSPAKISTLIMRRIVPEIQVHCRPSHRQAEHYVPKSSFRQGLDDASPLDRHQDASGFLHLLVDTFESDLSIPRPRRPHPPSYSDNCPFSLCRTNSVLGEVAILHFLSVSL